jgi:mono/diheme cytochrome c family protein
MKPLLWRAGSGIELLLLASLASLSAQAAEPAGRAVYLQHCAACHGATGDGNGPASVWLFPKPRNFNSGLFKIQSTPAGSLPSDEDLFQTITRGMSGSSMPSFVYLSEQERRDSVAYVKHLAATVGPDGKRVNVFDAAAKNGAARAVAVPAEPVDAVESLAQGREGFTKFGCVACHGETGAGDGPSAPTLKDSWGIPAPPRDFNTGSFRGGSTGRDLYLRILNGMAGTPMPPFPDETMKPNERWALVHYVQSLRRKDVEINDLLTPEDSRIPAKKVARVPATPTDPAWEQIDPVRVPLSPLWPEPSAAPAVAVTALHDGQRVAILCSWRDPIVNGGPVRVQDFQDGLALQFSLKGSFAFLGMGDTQNPVNLWFWRAGWQQESEGRKWDVEDQYASLHVDVYLNTNKLYRTAEAAGNAVAQPHGSPVEDANARGFGTLKSQSGTQQNVTGKGVWSDGHWSVVLVRQLESPDAEDVKFTVGQPVPVAFAVWNGEQRDRNGRKVISNWYQLVLE